MEATAMAAAAAAKARARRVVLGARRIHVVAVDGVARKAAVAAR